jgi:hypothetical protein
LNTQLKTPLEERNLLPKRTVELICEDNEKYKKARSPLRKAKEYNNPIGRPFFDVPLIQVRKLSAEELLSLLHFHYTNCQYLSCSF